MTQLICREETCLNGSILRLLSQSSGLLFFFQQVLFNFTFLATPKASLVAQTVKNLPAVQETWVRSLGLEDPLEEGKATHSSILAWRISTEEPGGPQCMGSQSRTQLSD